MRTVDRPLIRDVAALAAAAAVVGASFGAIAIAGGMPVWLASAMSMLVFAGGAQFMAVGVVAGGGSPVAAVLAGLLLNARHLPFGLAVADVLGPGWGRRLAGSHIMTDEAVAFALAQDDPRRRRTAYWLCGAALFVAWNLGVLAGALAGRAVGDPAALGVDAAFPAGLLALLLPTLRRPRVVERAGSPAAADVSSGQHGGTRLAERVVATVRGDRQVETAPRRVALAGAVIALAATPVLPAGVPVLLALLGLVVALV